MSNLWLIVPLVYSIGFACCLIVLTSESTERSSDGKR